MNPQGKPQPCALNQNADPIEPLPTWDHSRGPLGNSKEDGVYQSRICVIT